MENVIDKLTAKKRISANIRRMLASRGWDVADLVGKSGVPHNTCYRVARGDNVPDAATLANLAEALETSTDRLLAEFSENSAHST